MHIDNFATGDSLLHRLDPRVKIVVAILFSVVVAVADRYGCLATAVCLALTLLFLARLSLREVFLRLLVVNAFIVFLWLFLPFTYG
ncbi:MAG: cobalt ECF transporter T component CbiQ, partial [Deltaproteobacteria bacterium]|nr:cobalt ECF transporter T component CbiQ [Deltaproteobacteria bacterium]